MRQKLEQNTDPVIDLCLMTWYVHSLNNSLYRYFLESLMKKAKRYIGYSWNQRNCSQAEEGEDESLILSFFLQIFDGNFNEHEVVTRAFLFPFVAKSVRIWPVAWEKAICLRIELYGCPGTF